MSNCKCRGACVVPLKRAAARANCRARVRCHCVLACEHRIVCGSAITCHLSRFGHSWCFSTLISCIHLPSMLSATHQSMLGDWTIPQMRAINMQRLICPCVDEFGIPSVLTLLNHRCKHIDIVRTEHRPSVGTQVQ